MSILYVRSPRPSEKPESMSVSAFFQLCTDFEEAVPYILQWNPRKNLREGLEVTQGLPKWYANVYSVRLDGHQFVLGNEKTGSPIYIIDKKDSLFEGLPERVKEIIPCIDLKVDREKSPVETVICLSWVDMEFAKEDTSNTEVILKKGVYYSKI